MELHWPEGAVSLHARQLRAACRCAGCRSAPGTSGAAVDRQVRLTGATPVGHYALQLQFSDGHERGIFPWSLLRELGQPAPPPDEG